MLLPIFHPTTTVLVDDQQSYLDSVALAAPVDLPLATFTSPEAAIRTILERNRTADQHFNKILTLSGEIDSAWSNRTDEMIKHQIVRFDTGSLPTYIERADRYSDISVIVADYAMPEMNGIEFFRELGHVDQKRVLLTGQADERIAVQAFNDGIIDQFITKGQPNLAPRLFDLIRRYQRDYFQHRYNFLMRAYAAEDGSILANPDYLSLIQRYYREGSWLEHCVSHLPDHVMLFDEDGNAIRVVGMADNHYGEWIENAQRDIEAIKETEGEGSPAISKLLTFIQAMQDRKVIMCAPLQQVVADGLQAWEMMVRPAVAFEDGRKPLWYCEIDAREEIDSNTAAWYSAFPGRKLV